MGEKAGFRVNLASDSSASFFNANERSRFGVHLGSYIRLSGKWEVAVTQIITAKTEKETASPLYIYSSISVKVVVSDTMSRCLRILPPLSHTAINHFILDSPYYERVEFQEFQDIRIYLNDRQGNKYPLDNTLDATPTVIVLHFRPVQDAKE